MKKLTILTSIVLCTLFQFATAQTFNTIIGEEGNDANAGEQIDIGDRNVLIGDSTGINLTSPSGVVFIGYRAGYSTSSASDQNVYIGENAGFSGTSSSDNVFVGPEAGFFNTGSDNTFIGSEAGENNTSGGDNVFIGEEAGTSNTTGSDNVFIGQGAGLNNTTAKDNTFIGGRSGIFNTTGQGNTFVGGEADDNLEDMIYNRFAIAGDAAGASNIDGNFNTYIGAGAGEDASNSNSNTFIGYFAGGNTEFSGESTYVGAFAGWDNNRTDNSNSALRNNYFGFAAGGRNRDGSDNVGIGHDANFSDQASADPTINNRNIFIGNGTRINRTNDVVLVGHNGLIDNAANNSVGIGSQVNIAGQNSTGIGFDADIAAAATNAVGIGHQVDVDGLQATAIGSNAAVSGTNATAIGYQASTTANNEIFLGNTAITSIGGLVNWTATSDGRFKKNVQENVIGLDFINRLRPVTYNYDAEQLHALKGCETASLYEALIEKSQVRYSGFIAQEVEAAAKQLGYDFSGVDAPQNEDDIYGLRYAEFVVPLVKAVQELSEDNEVKEVLIAQQAAELAAYNKLLGDLTARVEALEVRGSAGFSVVVEE